MAAVNSGQALLERDDALGRIDRHLRDGIAGYGSMLLLEGQAGIGKTSVLLEAARRGRELGMASLNARSSELEQDFAYGLVRGLFEAPVVAGAFPQRTELFAGAARHVAPLFGMAAPQDAAADALLDPSFAILHGLYWLCANVSRNSPLLLSMDDIDWADGASLRFLHSLVRRVEELPVAVVAAARPGVSGKGPHLLAALAVEPSAEVVALAPLSEQAVAALVRMRLAAEVEPAFARACHQATGGGPFLVLELGRAITDEGVEPIAGASSRVPTAGSPPKARPRITSRFTFWRRTQLGTIGSSILYGRPLGPQSQPALQTRPPPTSSGRWRSRPQSCFVLTSSSNSASPNRMREIRRRLSISQQHSISQQARPLRSLSPSLWAACSRSKGVTPRRSKSSSGQGPRWPT